MKHPEIDSIYRLDSVATKNRYQVMKIISKPKEDRVLFLNTKSGESGNLNLKIFLQNFVLVEEIS